MIPMPRANATPTTASAAPTSVEVATSPALTAGSGTESVTHPTTYDETTVMIAKSTVPRPPTANSLVARLSWRAINVRPLPSRARHRSDPRSGVEAAELWSTNTMSAVLRLFPERWWLVAPTRLAFRVANQTDGVGRLVEGVVGEESAQQRLADAQDELQHLSGLHGPDDPREDPEHASLCATRREVGRWWFRENAPVARSLIRSEDAHLTLEAEHGPVHHRGAGVHRGIVDEVASGEAVGAVHDNVVAGEDVDGVVGGQTGHMGRHRYLGIDVVHPPCPADGLGLALVAGAVEHLSLQVRQFDHVVVDQAERADAGGRQVQGRGRAQPTGSDDDHASLVESLLAGDADLGESDVPGVAVPGGVAEVCVGHRWQPETHPAPDSPGERGDAAIPGILELGGHDGGSLADRAIEDDRGVVVRDCEQSCLGDLPSGC